MPKASFAELVAEGAAVPVAGWGFSWFAGRATEERPSWGYSRLMASRMSGASAALDVQTGGGEVLAGIPTPPSVLLATESWPPNVVIARRRLAALGASVVEVADDADLPLKAPGPGRAHRTRSTESHPARAGAPAVRPLIVRPCDIQLRSASFDLVVSRHPVVTLWDEVARVFRPGGTYLSQQVGAGSMRELTDYLMGPRPVSRTRTSHRAVSAAETAGLDVVDLREAALRMEFYDIAAVVHFLRKVIWTVPGSTVDHYRDRLAALHEQIHRDGAFIARAQRFLIETREPA